MQVMKCGECGCNAATIRAESKEGFDGYHSIEISCVNCGSDTLIRPFGALKVDREYGGGSGGSFTTGWHNDEESPIDKARRWVIEESIGMKVAGNISDLKLTEKGEKTAQELLKKWEQEGKIQ